VTPTEDTRALSDRFAFASYDSLEGVPVLAPSEVKASPRERIVLTVRRLSPGISIAVLVALSASWLADHYQAPVMLFALLLGMAVNFLGQDVRCRPGIDFASRQVLRVGVALLGARITLEQVQALGGVTLLIAAGGVVLTILAGWALARVMKLPDAFGVLTGGSVAICGASAAMAISSVLPASPTRERDTLLTVVGVTALSTLAMVIYPVIASLLGLSDHQTGIFLGATIHDVAQVVGAGYGVSKETGDTATIVKLFRVALLLPAILVIAFLFRAQGDAQAGGKRPPILPTFLMGFAALVAVNSTGLVPVELMEGVGSASRWFLVTAIAAVGAKTALGDLVHVGWRPVIMIVVETLGVMAWVLAAIALT
jgi:uncharacterized integral membrane protein (TIGR00698 family)